MKEFFVGIDLGGTRVKMGLVAGGVVLANRIIPAQAAGGLAACLPQLQFEAESMIGGLQLPMAGLRGVGFAFPGLVDTKQKKITFTNRKYDDATGIDLAQWTYDTWKVPFVIDNDAHMAAIGEWKYGAGRDTDDMVMMTIGTGIGSAAIMEGRLLRGKHFQAGCLGGHFTIQFTGGRCNCGNTGCAEIYGGSWGLKNRIEQHALYTGSLLKQAATLDFAAVFENARKDDPLSLIILEESMDAWAATMGNLVLAYDPEIVVLGGGVLKSADIILPCLQQKMKQLSWSPWGEVTLRASVLQEDAAIMGIVHTLQHSN